MGTRTAFTALVAALPCVAAGALPPAAFAQAAPAPAAPASPAAAPPQRSAAPLTLDEAVERAVRSNPRLAAAAGDVEAARSGVRSARALTNPTVTFTPAIAAGGSDEEILAQQPLELNGTRSARAGVARAQLRRTQAQAVVELRNLVQETKNAYFTLARAQEIRGLAGDVLHTAEEFHRGVRRQAEEGLRPLIDPVQTEIEVNRARQQLTLAEGQLTVARAALNTLMGRPPAEPLEVASLLGLPAAGAREPGLTVPSTQMPAGPAPGAEALPETADREALIAQALSRRAEIAAEQELGEQYRQEARLARAQGRPDLAPQFRVESITRAPRQPGFGIGITLPLIDWGSRRHRIRQAEAAARAQGARVEAAENQVRQEVVQALARLEAATEVVRQYRQGVLEQSRRLLSGSLSGLQLGAPGASILNVLEAQRTYRSVLTEFTVALADQAQAHAELERATGAVPADLLPGAAKEKEGPR